MIHLNLNIDFAFDSCVSLRREFVASGYWGDEELSGKREVGCRCPTGVSGWDPLEGQHCNGARRVTTSRKLVGSLWFRPHAGQQKEEEDMQIRIREGASRDHLQSTSRRTLMVLVSSLASWASVDAVQGLLLRRCGGAWDDAPTLTSPELQSKGEVSGEGLYAHEQSGHGGSSADGPIWWTHWRMWP